MDKYVKEEVVVLQVLLEKEVSNYFYKMNWHSKFESEHKYLEEKWYHGRNKYQVSYFKFTERMDMVKRIVENKEGMKRLYNVLLYIKSCVDKEIPRHSRRRHNTERTVDHYQHHHPGREHYHTKTRRERNTEYATDSNSDNESSSSDENTRRFRSTNYKRKSNYASRYSSEESDREEPNIAGDI